MSILDYSLYDNLRTRVNQDNFVYFYYSNRNEKNNFNCICSAMDWIDVALEYINNYKFNYSDSLNKQSIDFYTYISCIDIIYESVNQLSRVLLNYEHDIFRGEKDCFISRCEAFTDIDDNAYFKEIRACFGAHPVNIGKKGHKHFASWPSKASFTEGAYSILIYKSNISDNEFVFEVKIDELNLFLIKIYKFIEELVNKINEQYNSFCEEKREKAIQKDDDPHVYIENLINTSKERMNREDYSCILQFIKDVMNYSNANNDIILTGYKKFLITVLDDIYNNLQEMNFERETYNPYSPQIPEELDRPFGKLIESQRLGYLFPEQEEIKNYLASIINFNGISDVKEILILTLSGLYKKQSS